MNIVNEGSKGGEIDKNVQIALTIDQLLIPKTPPRKVHNGGSLEEWIKNLSPSPASSLEETKDSTKRVSLQKNGHANEHANSIVKPFNGSSTSVFGKRDSAFKKNQAPPPKAIKIEGTILNDSLNAVGLVIHSKTKGNSVRDMQQKKLLKSKFTKKVDPVDGKEKNIYSPKEFLLIVNYLIQKAKRNGLEYFNISELSSSDREKLVIEENGIYCSYPEKIFYQKLAQFKIDHHLSD